MKAIDITGERNGRLVAVRFVYSKRVNGFMRRFWLFKCDCGMYTVAQLIQVRGGSKKSCGCNKNIHKITHGYSKTKEYRSWSSMKQRCFNKNNLRFDRYGGRGISICKRWLKFENFLSDMGKRPTKNHSIDRINNDGDYTPENCRWATRSQQQRNKRIDISNKNRVRGDDHWTRKNRAKAIIIARKNIIKAHHSGENNSNAKVNKRVAIRVRGVYLKHKWIRMVDLGALFGIGRETTRKIVRGLMW